MSLPTIVIPTDILSSDEKRLLIERAGVGSIAWARQVRLDAWALEALLNSEPERPKVVPFGRRSSAAWGQP